MNRHFYRLDPVFAAIVLIVASLDFSCLADPGDRDEGFESRLEGIEAFSLSDDHLAVQVRDGSVAFLTRSGEEDAFLPQSPGNIRDIVVNSDADVRLWLQTAPSGRLLALAPPRIVDPARGTTTSFSALSDLERATTVDGAFLEDDGFLLATSRGVTRISGDGEIATVDPALSDSRSRRSRRFFPASDGQWFLLGDSLSRLSPLGLLDDTFQPVQDEIRYTAVVAAGDGKTYVGYEKSISGPILARLLANGQHDPSFEPISIEAVWNPHNWQISALAYNSETGGVFVGLSRTFSFELGVDVLHYVDADGVQSRYFRENASVEGGVDQLKFDRGDLYVLGTLKGRDETEAVQQLIRMDADMESIALPFIGEEPSDVEIPVGWPLSVPVDGVTLSGQEDRISYRWFKDGELLPGATTSELVIARTRYEDGGSYQLVMSDGARERRSRLIQVNVSGVVSEIDPNFATDLEMEFEYDTDSFYPTVQEDGKIVIAGRFQRINGLPSAGFARLNADGSLDESFPVNQEFRIFGALPAKDGTLYGRIRSLTRVTGMLPFGRRLPSGKFESFSAPAGFTEYGKLLAAIQPQDSKILRPVRSIDDPQSVSLVRIEPNGEVDVSFASVQFDHSRSASISSLVLLNDGKIFVSGRWDQVNGQTPTTTFSQNVVRLESDGSIDETFDPMPFREFSEILQLVKVEDKIAVANQSLIKMMRLDGSVDEQFNYAFSEAGYSLVSLDQRGRVYVSEAKPDARYTRLLPDGAQSQVLRVGTIDARITTFVPHLDGMLLTGRLTHYDDVAFPNRLVRLRPIEGLPVVFADRRLEAAIQKLLGIGEVPVTVESLAGIEELRLDVLGITDLRGLENARALSFLSIRGNGVADLSPIRDLAIEQLLVAGNPVALATSIEASTSGEVVVRWQSEPNVVYSVEESEDLLRWTSQESFTGNGALQTYRSKPVTESRYFRVVR